MATDQGPDARVRRLGLGDCGGQSRLFVEVVLYRYRTGMPWRDLPERFGEGTKVHRRFSCWAKSGVWERVFQHLAADADNEYAMTLA
jgi:transposase